jgi:uncharacterized protein (UPF0548 family)
VLLFSPPSDAELERFLARARESHYTYSELGATSGLIPPLYTTDHNRVLLGKGEADWYRAVTALRAWKMFDLGWMRLYPASTEIRAGENVALVARWFSLYFVNACRIVDTLHEHVPIRRYGFAYGTLEDHAESGEERFTLEWHRENDEVWYDLLAFSRPNQFLARVGYPFARQLQKRFAADSKAAMVRAVKA